MSHIYINYSQNYVLYVEKCVNICILVKKYVKSRILFEKLINGKAVDCTLSNSQKKQHHYNFLKNYCYQWRYRRKVFLICQWRYTGKVMKIMMYSFQKKKCIEKKIKKTIIRQLLSMGIHRNLVFHVSTGVYTKNDKNFMFWKS